MEFPHSEGPRRLSRLSEVLDEALIALDYDGTLAPIVDDPTRATIAPGAHEALLALGRRVRRVAVVTGRPVAQVLELGGLGDLAERFRAEGLQLDVAGQYGAQTWDSTSGDLRTPAPPPGLARFRTGLTALLDDLGAPGVWVEEKGLGVAVHTRRTADPVGTLERLSGPVAHLARQHGLVPEPGRAVLEVRSGDQDKGRALEALLAATGARAVCFAGDDLGDVPAFDAVDAARGRGLDTLLVCAGSAEQPVLRQRCDVVVDGPAGVVGLLQRLAPPA